MGGPNIIENIAKFDRWFTSGIRDGYEHDIEQSIRNENMSWSLEDFDKLCSGRYNAGSLTLDGAGRLDIVNNHVDKLYFLNGKAVSATDSFAIRRAFASALEENGLSKEQMDEVRTRLGLRRDNNTLSTGACFTPLRRQEVREIMDKYINDLNKDRPEDRRFVTQSQMHDFWGLTKEQSKTVKATRDATNESTRQDVKIPFDANTLRALDLISNHDFSSRAIFDDDALHDTALFFEDFEDRVEELANMTREDFQIWQHENPGKRFYLPVEGEFSISLDPKTRKVLFSSKLPTSNSKLVTFSTGMKPETMLKRIRAANERLHAEGAKRGLNLAGKEFVDANAIKESPKPKKSIIDDDNSIIDSPKIKKNIIEEPIGGKGIIETNDVIKPRAVKLKTAPKGKIDTIGTKDVKQNQKIKREGKYIIIEEREDEPKEPVKMAKDTLIPVEGDDDGSDDESNSIIITGLRRKMV